MGHRGIYVAGSINGEAIITVDVESTLLSYDVYMSIHGSERPKLRRSTFPAGLDRTLRYHGQALFEIKMGPLVGKRLMIAVNMLHGVILGADVFLKEQGDSAVEHITDKFRSFKKETGGRSRDLKI